MKLKLNVNSHQYNLVSASNIVILTDDSSKGKTFAVSSLDRDKVYLNDELLKGTDILIISDQNVVDFSQDLLLYFGSKEIPQKYFNRRLIILDDVDTTSTPALNSNIFINALVDKFNSTNFIIITRQFSRPNEPVYSIDLSNNVNILKPEEA
jgi:hypothetical protein